MNGKINDEALIRLFRESGERREFLSGEEVARELGVTRAAVWKRIRALRKGGYVFETSAAQGYRLIAGPDLSEIELRSLLQESATVVGREILFYDSLGSTNTVALELAGAGASEGAVVIADSQSSGRGRRGRAWLSPPGTNLSLSVILRPDLSPREAAMLTLLAAVAAASALQRTTALPVSIKWPNDLMVRGKKLGGILTEIRADMDRIFHAVVGIGININLGSDDLPADLKGTATSSLIETGIFRQRAPLAAELLKELDLWYALYLAQGRGPVLTAWRRMSDTLGRTVRAVLNDEALTGVADDIDDEGMLLIREENGTVRRVSAGDITILR